MSSTTGLGGGGSNKSNKDIGNLNNGGVGAKRPPLPGKTTKLGGTLNAK